MLLWIFSFSFSFSPQRSSGATSSSQRWVCHGRSAATTAASPTTVATAATTATATATTAATATVTTATTAPASKNLV